MALTGTLKRTIRAAAAFAAPVIRQAAWLIGSAALRALLRADLLIRRALDRILPANLTMRYILGLGVIAALASVGQILAQVSLQDQLDDQKIVRTLDRQVPLFDELRKATVALQLSSSAGEAQLRHASVRALFARIASTQAAIEREPRLLRRMDDSGIMAALRHEMSGLAAAAATLDSAMPGETGQGPGPVPSPEFITQVSKALLESSSATQEQLKNAMSRLEALSEERVSNFRSKEFALYLGTLLMLVIEALYVFRPAVERLYGALRARSDFLGRMSHELRNPLNSILGMGKLLAEAAESERQKRYLSVLMTSGSSLLEILNNILDFASFESGKIKLDLAEFDLVEALDRCLDLAVVGAHASGTELVLDAAPDVPVRVLGDPVRLQQVLSNLLGNAVKFTRAGTVVLEVRAESARDGDVRVRFSVKDTGVGIEPENIPRILQPFVQEDASVRRRFGGTGLGLAISKELIEKMGGRLEIESRKNVGSRFSFALPMGGADGPDLAETLRARAVPGLEAVIREDNAEARQALGRILESAGARVRFATDAEEVARLRAERVPRRVFLVGSDPAEAGASLDGRTVFLLRTTAATDEIGSLVSRGAGGVLFKPARPAQLMEAIGRIASARESRRSARAAAPARRDAEAARFLRILVADDSVENQVLYEAYLQPFPCELEFARDGREAVALFKRSRFDAVLMDIQMPELDGYAAAEQIREWERLRGASPPVPIIGMSAYNMDPEMLTAFTGYKVKPVDPEDLRATLAGIARGSGAEGSGEAGPGGDGDEAAAADGPRESGPGRKTLAERIAALAPAYLESRRKEAGAIEGLLRRAEFGPIERIGHQLRGNALSYGFPALGEAGAALEAAARARDAARVEDALLRIRRELG